MKFVWDDGGRKEAGFKGETRDCVTRSIAIAAKLDYQDVYDELAERYRVFKGKKTARNGIPRKIYEPYLLELGWIWVPTMFVGVGCQVHMREEELPAGRLICRLSKHLCAVVDGVVHDNHNPCRDGSRAVYGYFQKP